VTVRLTVNRADWRHHVQGIAAQYGDALVPVVKGNGYGFSRPVLHDVARQLQLGTVCVGSVHELHDVPADLEPVVLTPALAAPQHPRAVLTVGSEAHARALHGWGGRVMVKIASSMRRYGAAPHELPGLLRAVGDTGSTVIGIGLHLPLAGNDEQRRAEVEAWLPHLDPAMPLWLSHLQPDSFADLVAAHPQRTFRIRVGTALWHGVPKGPFLHLGADVIDTRPVSAGDRVGYWHSVVESDGTLVAIGAGSAAGIAPLDDADPARRSPFHFARQRLALVERPHMHTSLVVVPHDQPCPAVGDLVDVQRPLIGTQIDELRWE
jgi:alanine racemase